MKLADSLAAVSAYRRATAEYVIVAKQYPATQWYPKAVYKAAILYCNANNPAADDSTSLSWFRVYRSLPISAEEKLNADICISLLDRIRALQEQLQKLREIDVLMNKKEGK